MSDKNQTTGRILKWKLNGNGFQHKSSALGFEYEVVFDDISQDYFLSISWNQDQPIHSRGYVTRNEAANEAQAHHEAVLDYGEKQLRDHAETAKQVVSHYEQEVEGLRDKLRRANGDAERLAEALTLAKKELQKAVKHTAFTCDFNTSVKVLQSLQLHNERTK